MFEHLNTRFHHHRCRIFDDIVASFRVIAVISRAKISKWKVLSTLLLFTRRKGCMRVSKDPTLNNGVLSTNELSKQVPREAHYMPSSAVTRPCKKNRAAFEKADLWGVIKNPHEPGHCTIFRRPRVPFVGPNFHKWKFFDALCSMDTLFSPMHKAELHVPDVGGMHCVSNVCFCSIKLLDSDQFDASGFQSSSTTIEGVETASAACSCLPIAPFLPI